MDIDLIKLHLRTARNATLRDGPGQRDQQCGWTRLHAAVAYGNLDRVRSLLGLVNASSGDGWTPLHVAVGLSGDSDSDIRQEALSTILETLLRAGADRNARNKDGWTPLHVAAALNHDHTASVVGRLAAEYGVHDFFMEARDSKGRTALHIAASKNNTEEIRVLCDRGSDRDARDRAGNTPLHKASAKEKCGSVRLLLVSGADRWLKNGKGQLPIDLAGRNEKLRSLLATP